MVGTAAIWCIVLQYFSRCTLTSMSTIGRCSASSRNHVSYDGIGFRETRSTRLRTIESCNAAEPFNWSLISHREC